MATVPAKVVATSSLTSMLTEAKTFLAYGPKIASAVETVATKFPDIEAQGAKLVSGLTSLVADAKALNPTAAIDDAHKIIAAGVALYDDLGLPKDLVSSIAEKAPSLPSVAGLETAFSGLEKLFGL